SARAAELLLSFRRNLQTDGPAVLFASSDHMVRSIAQHWGALREEFRTSWSASVELVPKLIDKSNLEALCRERDLLYPHSFILTRPDAVAEARAAIGMPMLAKPIRPLSGFKALRIAVVTALEALVERYADDL